MLLHLYHYLAVKYLDNIPEDQIAELNIPTGVPLVYSLDADLKPIPHANAIAPLQVQWVHCVSAENKCVTDLFMNYFIDWLNDWINDNNENNKWIND